MKIPISLILMVLIFTPGPLLSADKENCLMCHKYSGMGRYETVLSGKGRKRIFYINKDLFKETVHGELRCKDCHSDVTKIPHDRVRKVDCAKDCHIQDPSSGKEFSHRRIAELLKKSVHGVEGTNNPRYRKDLPTCTYCHNNPLNTVSDSKDHLYFLNICMQCHEKEEWARRFLKHQFYRMGKRRSSKEIVALCSSCHENKRMMDRHKLDVVIGFRDTYHGKAIAYGNEKVANCLSCHAPRSLGFTPHSIVSKRDLRSPVNPANRLKTCKNRGCHPGATREFALGRKKIHPSGVEGLIKLASYRPPGGTENPSKGSDPPLPEALSEEVFHEKVVYWINTGYKIAIALIVGGMLMHQTLDFVATIRERRREEEEDG